MTPRPTRADSIQRDLAYIQSFSRETLYVLAAAIMAVWILAIPISSAGAANAVEPWWGALVLGIGVALAWPLQDRFPVESSILFVCFVLAASTLLILGIGWGPAAYAFAISVLLMSTILSPVCTVLFAMIAIGLLYLLGITYMRLGPLSPQFVGPVIAVVGATLAAWLNARNLQFALRWASESNLRAWESAREARERRGNLARALKALDESSYRIERLNHQLRLALNAAKEAERIKARFAANISHELRTPLNLIVGFAGLLFEHPELYDTRFSPQCLRDLNIIYRNALQLQRLVNDVLDLSEIHTAHMAFNPEIVQPAGLIHETVDTVRGLIESKGLELQVDIPPNLPSITVDRMRISQVLINLLNNAARFTDRGSIRMWIEQQDSRLTFGVQDTGIGIPDKDIPLLFKEFHQLDDSLTRRRGGTGLGLAISKAFVELHGGEMHVESQVGSGSTFTFSLPTDSRSASIRFLESAQSSYYRGKDVILALSHSRRGLRLLQRYLVGHQVVMARDVAHANQLITDYKPQWILIDNATLTDSAQSLEQTVASLETDNVPVLACDLPQDARGNLAPNVKGYLVKPVANQDLQQVLRQFGSTVGTILVVDDDHDFVRLITRLLNIPPLVYRVLRAYSAQEALDLAAARSPDLIFLDLGLPEVDGMELLAIMGQHPALASIPVIIVTGQMETEDEERRGSTSCLLVTAKEGGLETASLFDCIQRLFGLRGDQFEATQSGEQIFLSDGLDQEIVRS